nr:hypothetical protein [Ferrovum sp.]
MKLEIEVALFYGDNVLGESLSTPGYYRQIEIHGVCVTEIGRVSCEGSDASPEFFEVYANEHLSRNLDCLGSFCDRAAAVRYAEKMAEKYRIKLAGPDVVMRLERAFSATTTLEDRIQGSTKSQIGQVFGRSDEFDGAMDALNAWNGAAQTIGMETGRVLLGNIEIIDTWRKQNASQG